MGFFVCVHDTAATHRGHYLALSKAWQYSFCHRDENMTCSWRSVCLYAAAGTWYDTWIITWITSESTAVARAHLWSASAHAVSTWYVAIASATTSSLFIFPSRYMLAIIHWNRSLLSFVAIVFVSCFDVLAWTVLITRLTWFFIT